MWVVVVKQCWKEFPLHCEVADWLFEFVWIVVDCCDINAELILRVHSKKFFYFPTSSKPRKT